MLRRALLEEEAARPPLERLRRYFEAYAESLAKQGFARGCLLGSLSAEIADHSDAVRERLIRAFADWRDMVAAVLEEARARGELPDGLSPAAAADFLVNGWEGALVRMKTEKSGQPLTLFIATAFDRLLVSSDRKRR